MNPLEFHNAAYSRRHFFRKSGTGLGMAALASLLGQRGISAAESIAGINDMLPQIAPKAKRAIYISLIGAPSQIDLFDYKPELQKRFKEDLNGYLKAQGQRLTGMTSGQATFPLAPSIFKFNQHGQSGTWISELLPWTAKMADDICIIKSMHTDAINHEPAICAMQTGNQITGRPCLGSWASYGLGSENDNLPNFVVLIATPTNRDQEQAISSRLWSSGYLPGEHAGVSFRSKGDPILFINNPPGVPDDLRKQTIDGINQLNRLNYETVGDPETHTRIKQYEMAFRMQASVPELTDLAKEPEHIFKLYGEEARKRGSFANSVLMARRLVERGVRFVQIYHNNWDHHSNVNGRMPSQCKDIDQPCHALIEDLKQRGMFDDTLIVWGGEFGRTIYSQGGLTKENYGRDHHPRCFSMWMAGGGAKGGQIYGETDEFSYNIVKDPLPINDFHATVLHLLGYDHERFTYKYQGLDQKLTGVLPTKVVKALVA